MSRRNENRDFERVNSLPPMGGPNPPNPLQERLKARVMSPGFFIVSKSDMIPSWGKALAERYIQNWQRHEAHSESYKGKQEIFTTGFFKGDVKICHC